jgi:hypothetical protein
MTGNGQRALTKLQEKSAHMPESFDHLAAVADALIDEHRL